METPAGSGVVPGTLYIVSTPIGNLGDVTARAAAILGAVDEILAEDTRTSRVLLDHLGVRTPLRSLHEHNEAAQVAGVVSRLRAGSAVALVSDAGTPLVSDPGERLVAAVVEAGLAVCPVPGASAVLAALAASGLSAVPFTFLGFVPRKGQERGQFEERLAASPWTTVSFESPHRVAETLVRWDALGLGDRPMVLARELTKRFETFTRGTVREVAAYVAEHPVRGEVVLVVGGAPPPALPDVSALTALADEWNAAGLSPREIHERLMAEHGVPRNLAYRLAHR
jgi:16S rRNA (cytidine1402-2'-O)-methyltransferase